MSVRAGGSAKFLGNGVEWNMELSYERSGETEYSLENVKEITSTTGNNAGQQAIYEVRHAPSEIVAAKLVRYVFPCFYLGSRGRHRLGNNEKVCV